MSAPLLIEPSRAPAADGLPAALDALADPLSDAFRVVRRLAPPEAPVSGLLARMDDDAVLLVEPEVFGADETGRGPHVWAPIDVARMLVPPRTLLVLPWCTMRLETYLADRRAEGVPLRDGEAVTLAVSALRGLRALRSQRDHDEARGTWWVTAEGCPVFVRGSGEPISAATEHLWSDAVRTAQTTRVAQMLARLDGEADESTLFALAEPLPIAAPTPRGGAVEAGTREYPGDSDDLDADEDGPQHWSDLLYVAAQRLSDALHRVRSGRLRRSPGGRRPVFILAGVIALAVLGVGMLWPEDAPSDAAPAAAADAAANETSPTGRAADSAQTGAVEAPADGSPEAFAGILSALLDRRAACAGEPDCLAQVMADPARVIDDAGAIDLPAGRREITLLDDLGGVAVLSVAAGERGSSEAAAAQFVVIVKDGDRWLLRDVHPAVG